VTTRQKAIEALCAEQITASRTQSSPVGLHISPGTKIWQSELWNQALFSVQDESAQLVSGLTPLKPEMKVLDACAAPGGKTAHLLEAEPGIDLTALDINAARVAQIRENLARLKLECSIRNADARDLESWWQGEQYDLIVLDAPCSGTGVIRRHPDIKHLRQPEDIAENVETQRQLLAKLWSVLKVGGNMLYCTCSILRQENDLQAGWMLENNADAKLISLPACYGMDVNFGRQRLPGEDDSDGFYYAYFEKNPS
jgi:16S rRNA (cytosine967-C5)-methyltransferase